MNKHVPRVILLFLFIVLVQVIAGPVFDRIPDWGQYGFMAVLNLIGFAAFIWALRQPREPAANVAFAVAVGVVAGTLFSNLVFMVALSVDAIRS